MSQIASHTNYTDERTTGTLGSAMPLGLIALAFTTALIGCSFARFLIPTSRMGIGLVIGAALLFGGIVQFIAGIVEFRRGNSTAGTVFASYGGFLATLGVFFLPASGLLGFFGGNTLALNHALGVLFLCWTISIGVFLLASARGNPLMTAVLALLGLAYLFLTIGSFANANTPLMMIGGWLAIVCALVSWYTALAGMLSSAHGAFHVPMEQVA
jgi:succinate-acetate transporter protein